MLRMYWNRKEGSKPLLSSVYFSHVLYMQSVYPWIYENDNHVDNFQAYHQRFLNIFYFIFANYQVKRLL